MVHLTILRKVINEIKNYKEVEGKNPEKLGRDLAAFIHPSKYDRFVKSVQSDPMARRCGKYYELLEMEVRPDPFCEPSNIRIQPFNVDSLHKNELLQENPLKHHLDQLVEFREYLQTPKIRWEPYMKNSVVEGVINFEILSDKIEIDFDKVENLGARVHIEEKDEEFDKNDLIEPIPFKMLGTTKETPLEKHKIIERINNSVNSTINVPVHAFYEEKSDGSLEHGETIVGTREISLGRVFMKRFSGDEYIELSTVQG